MLKVTILAHPRSIGNQVFLLGLRSFSAPNTNFRQRRGIAACEYQDLLQQLHHVFPL